MAMSLLRPAHVEGNDARGAGLLGEAGRRHHAGGRAGQQQVSTGRARRGAEAERAAIGGRHEDRGLHALSARHALRAGRNSRCISGWIEAFMQATSVRSYSRISGQIAAAAETWNAGKPGRQALRDRLLDGGSV